MAHFIALDESVNKLLYRVQIHQAYEAEQAEQM